MRRSEVEAIADRIKDQIWSNTVSGHPPLSEYRSADNWETRPPRTKERICRMLTFLASTVPWMLDDQLIWVVEADEGITCSVNDILNNRADMERVALLIIENAKINPALDCIRGEAMKQWLSRRKWYKIMKKWPPILNG